MTPTEQDKELREKINSLFESVFSQGFRAGKDVAAETYEDFDAWRKGDEIDEIMKLITADRKRVALEARIAELNKIALDTYRGKTVSESTNWQAKFEYFMDSNERRIAGLKARQEEGE